MNSTLQQKMIGVQLSWKKTLPLHRTESYLAAIPDRDPRDRAEAAEHPQSSRNDVKVLRTTNAFGRTRFKGDVLWMPDHDALAILQKQREWPERLGTHQP